jgi:hypothetical protein
MDFVVLEIFFVVGTRCGNMVIRLDPGVNPVQGSCLRLGGLTTAQLEL